MTIRSGSTLSEQHQRQSEHGLRLGAHLRPAGICPLHCNGAGALAYRRNVAEDRRTLALPNRAIDAGGQIVDVSLSDHRNTVAARPCFKQAIDTREGMLT
jgi:hypothetical protein